MFQKIIMSFMSCHYDGEHFFLQMGRGRETNNRYLCVQTGATEEVSCSYTAKISVFNKAKGRHHNIK